MKSKHKPRKHYARGYRDGWRDSRKAGKRHAEVLLAAPDDDWVDESDGFTPAEIAERASQASIPEDVPTEPLSHRTPAHFISSCQQGSLIGWGAVSGKSTYTMRVYACDLDYMDARIAIYQRMREYIHAAIAVGRALPATPPVVGDKHATVVIHVHFCKSAEPIVVKSLRTQVEWLKLNHPALIAACWYEDE
jgi:hypothetical protein